jgi:hypothetical protein
MSYEYEYAMGSNGTSNVSGSTGVHRLAHPILTLKRTTATPSTPSTTEWPMFNGGSSTPPPVPSEDPGAAPDEPDFMTTTEEPSAMPWIIGIGAVTALGVGGFFLWKYLSKEETPSSLPKAPVAPQSNPMKYIPMEY